MDYSVDVISNQRCQKCKMNHSCLGLLNTLQADIPDLTSMTDLRWKDRNLSCNILDIIQLLKSFSVGAVISFVCILIRQFYLQQ